MSLFCSCFLNKTNILLAKYIIYTLIQYCYNHCILANLPIYSVFEMLIHYLADVVFFHFVLAFFCFKLLATLPLPYNLSLSQPQSDLNLDNAIAAAAAKHYCEGRDKPVIQYGDEKVPIEDSTIYSAASPTLSRVLPG